MKFIAIFKFTLQITCITCRFVNVATVAAVEVPGTLVSLFIIQKMGRKHSLILANVIAGVSCLVIVFCPQGLKWLRITLGAVSMFGLAMCFPIVYVYAGELFPTVVRNMGCGITSMFARIGSMMAPFLARSYLPDWFEALVFGLAPLVSALLCLLLPETINCKLPDTIEEAEVFGKRREGAASSSSGN